MGELNPPPPEREVHLITNIKYMTYEYYTKEVYGIQKNYIVENGFQQIHKTLTGCTTLREIDFQLYQSLGLNFKQVLPPKTK